MLSVSRTCFNEFLSLLDIAWVNKVLLLLLLFSLILFLVFCYIGSALKKKVKSLLITLLAEPFFCLLDFGVREKGSA